MSGRRSVALGSVCVLAFAACATRAPSPIATIDPAAAQPNAGSAGPSSSSATLGALPPGAAVPTAPPQLDPDGNDDDDPAAAGVELPEVGHFERVGKPPLALQRICDLTPFGDALYAAHANAPLGTDGATISRYQPSNTDRPWTVAFDWNREGEPTKGGGAGQGFLRVRVLGGRLFVPDTDPPYLGFWMSKTAVEGFVFISNPAGEFAHVRNPGHLPPLPPRGTDGKGSGVLAGAFHVLDVIRYRGHFYASTGSLPPGGNLNSSAAPGALDIASDDLSHWDYALGYPDPPVPGVWRLTYLVRFRDRLYAGIQDYDARDPHDYVVFEPRRDADRIQPADAHPTSVTGSLGTQTYRWFADGGKLFWIARTYRGVELNVSEDGDRWAVVPLPTDVGAPTDIARVGSALVVLTERALVRLDGTSTRVIARVTDKRSPFELNDFICAAPLALFQGKLYAGGQRGGFLYVLAAGAEPQPPVAPDRAKAQPAH